MLWGTASRNLKSGKTTGISRWGDILQLREWDPEENKYTGRSMRRMILYKLSGGSFGIEEGYCVLSLE